ncbi:MAG: hypothetical protein VBE63_22335 [Lamprobacter sp.]|uniref:hypothetical protein n=1 Tax=Lamprobacter sp. TaxID=3100796 RepID=UPI002B2572FB|nr:hypothetical protein [Lamprobacter sp.]MEA3642655.1 hypothetical protein [Lamprobacter sp.]
MLRLAQSAAASSTSAFNTTLTRELEALGPQHPALHPMLQAGLSQSSAVADEPVSISILGVDEDEGQIRARLGVLYSGIIAGCSCADDPTPAGSLTERCELLLDLDCATGSARLSLLDRC